jgi:hypothetical protein
MRLGGSRCRIVTGRVSDTDNTGWPSSTGPRLDLVREVHAREDEHTVADAKSTDVVAVVEHEPYDSDEPGALHRLHEEQVDLLGALLRADEVQALVRDRVDLSSGTKATISIAFPASTSAASKASGSRSTSSPSCS